MNKKRRSELIEIELEGIPYKGERVIEGTIKLNQYIIYKDKCIPDPQQYSSAAVDSEMKAYAKLLLSELVTGRTLSAQPKSKYRL